MFILKKTNSSFDCIQSERANERTNALDLLTPTSVCEKRGLGEEMQFSTIPRFVEEKMDNIPGPGYYTIRKPFLDETHTTNENEGTGFGRTKRFVQVDTLKKNGNESNDRHDIEGESGKRNGVDGATKADVGAVIRMRHRASPATMKLKAALK